MALEVVSMSGSSAPRAAQAKPPAWGRAGEQAGDGRSQEAECQVGGSEHGQEC